MLIASINHLFGIIGSIYKYVPHVMSFHDTSLMVEVKIETAGALLADLRFQGSRAAHNIHTKGSGHSSNQE